MGRIGLNPGRTVRFWMNGHFQGRMATSKGWRWRYRGDAAYPLRNVLGPPLVVGAMGWRTPHIEEQADAFVAPQGALRAPQQQTFRSSWRYQSALGRRDSGGVSDPRARRHHAGNAPRRLARGGDGTAERDSPVMKLLCDMGIAAKTAAQEHCERGLALQVPLPPRSGTRGWFP